MVWVACSNFSYVNVRLRFLGTELITGRLDAQRQLGNPPISILQFPILTLMTWRQDKRKPRVPETEGSSQEWTVVQAAELVLRYLVKGGRVCPSVVPKRWSLEQQLPSPENLEPQISWVSEEGPGPGKLHSKELPLWFWWFFWFGYHWDLWKTLKDAQKEPFLIQPCFPCTWNFATMTYPT